MGVQVKVDSAYDLAPCGQPQVNPGMASCTSQGKVLIIQTDEPDVDFSASLKEANYGQFPRSFESIVPNALWPHLLANASTSKMDRIKLSHLLVLTRLVYVSEPGQ